VSSVGSLFSYVTLSLCFTYALLILNVLFSTPNINDALNSVSPYSYTHIYFVHKDNSFWSASSSDKNVIHQIHGCANFVRTGATPWLFVCLYEKRLSLL